MPDTSAELNLALALGADDTRDYLAGSSNSLRSSLLVLDGLFNTTTGHTHNGAHQGGQFTNLTLGQDLAVGRDLTVGRNARTIGTSTLTGATFCQSTLDVTGVTHLIGAIQADSAMTVSGAITANGAIHSYSYVLAGPDLTLAVGDLGANRGNGTGYVFFSSTAHSLGWNGTNYVMPGPGSLLVNNDTVVTLAASQTLTNKTLTSPTLTSALIGGGTLTNPTLAGTVTGAPAWSSAQSFPTGTRVGTLLAIGSRSTNWCFDGGQNLVSGIATGGSTTLAISFTAAFSTPPIVVCSPQAWSGGIGSIGPMNWEVVSVTTSGFTVAVYNNTGGTQSVTISWMAFGS